MTPASSPAVTRSPRFKPRLLAASLAVFALLASSAEPTGAAKATEPARGTAPGHQVASAWSFLNSIGVNVHMNYNDTTYRDPNLVLRQLASLGVRHVRDGLDPKNAGGVSGITKLGRAGYGLTLLTGGPSQTNQKVDRTQIVALRKLAPYLDAVEQPNEYDCSGDPSWQAHLSAFAKSQSTVLKSEQKLSKVAILGPSFCQMPSVSQYKPPAGSYTVANLHNYSREATPEVAIEGRVPQAQRAQQELPMRITESGFSNAVNSPGQPTFSEADGADYTLRLLLDAFNLGVDRTFLYELLDEKPDPALTDYEQHFGLSRTDGTAKPVFTAVRNLLRDISRTAPVNVAPTTNTVPGPSVTISGGGDLVRSTTIADPTGPGFTVALWLAQPLGGRQQGSASVHLETTDAYTVTSQRPSRGNAVVNLGTKSGMTVTVDGAVTLVHFGHATSVKSTRDPMPAPSAPDWMHAKGVLVTSDLAPTSTTWTGAPASDSSLPNGLPAGTTVGGGGQTTHIVVPGSPDVWTVTVWQKTSTTSANFAAFLRATDARGAVMRTYDLTSDAPSHMQLSAYGLPVGTATWGSEAFGQALVDRWHLLSLSSDGSSATFSIDGIVQQTFASSSTRLHGLDLGSLSPGYRGSLGSLAVFPSVLNSADLTALTTMNNN